MQFKKILKQFCFFTGNSLSGNLNLKTLDLSANCIASLKVQFIVLSALTCSKLIYSSMALDGGSIKKQMVACSAFSPSLHSVRPGEITACRVIYHRPGI